MYGCAFVVYVFKMCPCYILNVSVVRRLNLFMNFAFTLMDFFTYPTIFSFVPCVAALSVTLSPLLSLSHATAPLVEAADRAIAAVHICRHFEN